MPTLKPLAFLMPLLLNNFTTSPTPKLINSSIQISATPPDAPKTPRSPGERIPGGGRNPDDGSCPNTTPKLTALVPANSIGKTISEHPTFWFYIPYTSKEIVSVEFSLHDLDEKRNFSEKRIYQIPVKIPQKPGIISVALPPESKNFLKLNKYYRWYLQIECKSHPDDESKPTETVNGYVQRVTLNSSSINSLTPELWYDFLTQLAEKHLNSSSEPILNSEWTKLLKSVGLEGLAQKSLLGSTDTVIKK